MDLRKPGEEEDEYSEMAEEAMDPDNCFPDSKYTLIGKLHSTLNCSDLEAGRINYHSENCRGRCCSSKVHYAALN